MAVTITYTGAASGSHDLEGGPLTLTTVGSYTITCAREVILSIKGVAGGGGGGRGSASGGGIHGAGGGGGGASHTGGVLLLVHPSTTYAGTVGGGGAAQASGTGTAFGVQSQTPVLEWTGGGVGGTASGAGAGLGGDGGNAVQGAGGLDGGQGGNGGARFNPGVAADSGSGARGGGGGGGGGNQGGGVTTAGAGADGGDNTGNQDGGAGGAAKYGTPFNGGGSASGVGSPAATGGATDDAGGGGGGGGGAEIAGAFYGGGGGGGGGIDTGTPGAGGAGDDGVLVLTLEQIVDRPDWRSQYPDRVPAAARPVTFPSGALTRPILPPPLGTGRQAPVAGSGVPRGRRLTQYLAHAAPLLAQNPQEGATESWRPHGPDWLSPPRGLHVSQQPSLSARDPFPPTPPAVVPEQWQPQFTLPPRRKTLPNALLPTLASVVGNLRTVVVGWSYPDEVHARLRLLSSGGTAPILPIPSTVTAPTGGAVADSGVLADLLRFQYQTLTGPLRVFPGVFQVSWQQLYPALVTRQRTAFAAQQALSVVPAVSVLPVPPYRPPILTDLVRRLWRPAHLPFIAQDLRQAQPAPPLSSPILPDWLPARLPTPTSQTLLALLPTGLLDLAWYQQQAAWLPAPRLVPEGAWTLGWQAISPVNLEWWPQAPLAPPLRQPQREPTYTLNAEPIPNPPSPDLAWRGYQPDWFPEPPFLRTALHQAWASDRIRPEAPDLSWQGWAPDQVRSRASHPSVHPQHAPQIEQLPQVFHEGWGSQYPDSVRRRPVQRVSDLWVPWEPTQAPGWAAVVPAWLARTGPRRFDLSPFAVGALVDIGLRLGWQPTYPGLLWRPVWLPPSGSPRQPPQVTPDSWCVILYAPEVRTPALQPAWLLVPALEETALVTPTLAHEEVC